MPAKAALGSVQADVQTALASCSTCIDETAQTVQKLLFPKNAPSPKVIGQSDARSASSTRKHGTKIPKSGLEAKAPETTNTSLSIHDRYLFATNVVNISLKTINNQSKLLESNVRSAKQKSRDGSGTSPVRHLLESSPNRHSKEPPAEKRKGNTNQCQEDSALENVAKCAYAAFQFLSAQNKPKSVPSDLKMYQLENGLIAFISKLLALNMHDQALRGLKLLHELLEPYSETSNPRTKAKANALKDIAKQTLQPGDAVCELFKFHVDDSLKGPRLQLAINHQLLVLKLLRSCPRLAKTSLCSLPNHLDLAVPCCPTNLISRLADDSQDKNQSAHQLEALSQIMLIISSNATYSDTGNELTSPNRDFARACFLLRTCALHTRIRWTKMVNHYGDVESETIQPFAKYLQHYIQRSADNSADKYQLASRAFEDLRGECFKEQTLSSSLPKSSPLVVILERLSRLAEAAGDLDGALEWHQYLMEAAANNEPSQTKRVTIASRSAILALKRKEQTIPWPTVASLTREVTGLLGNEMCGSPSDLSDLLYTIFDLKKRLVGLLKLWHSSTRKSLGLGCLGAIDCIREFLKKGLQLFGRFLHADKEMTRDDKSNGLEQQLKKTFLRMSSSFMESCVLDLNLSSLGLSISLAFVDETTSACLNALKYLEAYNSNEKDLQETGDSFQRFTHSPFVTLSNVYWNMFLGLKTSVEASSSTDIEHALRKSCDLLIARGVGEKKDGDLSLKLHQLGRTLRSYGRATKARNYYLSSIEVSVATGVVQEVASLARSLPLKLAWQSNDRIKLLGRSIGALLDAIVDDDCEPLLETGSSSEKGLKDDERGIFLEYQMLLLSEHDHQSSKVKKKANELCQHLLHIYDEKKFPVRRLRVLLRASILGLPDQDGHCTAAMNYAEPTSCSSDSDAQLYKYSKHLQASLRLNLAIQSIENSRDNLDSALEYWKPLVESVPSNLEFCDFVEDLDEWTNQLQATGEFLESQGMIKSQIDVMMLLAMIYRSSQPLPNTKLCSVYIRIANACLRSDDTNQARVCLEKAQTLSESCKIPENEMRLHASFVEYFLAIRNSSKAEEHLQLLIMSCREKGAGESSDRPLQVKSEKDHMLQYCDALVVAAQFSAEVGPLNDAIYYSKKCAALLRSFWKHLEQKAGRSTTPLERNQPVSDEEALAEDMKTLVISPKDSKLDQSALEKSITGPTFWPLLPRLFGCLVTTSSLYERLGMYEDALCTAEETTSVAANANANGLHVISLLLKGQLHARSGDSEAGRTNLEQALEVSKKLETNKSLALLHCCFGYLHRLQSNWQTEWREYEEAESILDQISDMTHEESPEGSKVAPISAQKHYRTKSKTTGQRKATIQPARPGKGHPKQSPKLLFDETSDRAPILSKQRPSFTSLRVQIICNKAISLLLQGNFQEAAVLVDKTYDHSLSQDLNSYYRGILGRVRLNQGLFDIAKDPVCSMLPDATISVPAIAEIVQDTKESANFEKSTTHRMSSFAGPLHEALNISSEKLNQLVQVGSTAALLQNLSTFATASMLTSFAYSASMNISMPSGLVAYAVDIPAVIAWSREHMAMKVHQDRESFKTLYTWRHKQDSADDQQLLKLDNFQESFVDVLPSNWTVVSMTISDDRQHLCLILYESKQSPFVLRIPLNRQSSHDMEEETFTFDEAKSELQDIIQMSDETIHWGRDNSEDLNTPGAKSDWWSEREGLDNRLRTLLVNIENLWFGGFQGILSHHQRHPDLLARFHQSFESILDKYLPSRQRTFKRGSTGKVALNRKIFELFVALGDRQDDEDFDLDEALTDLLYFVVDILQFNGEQNAYDEIDFDSLVVETQDALKSYFDSTRLNPVDETKRHMILIPDKQLHLFPWESMGCLQNKSVSRVLSLADVRDRILLMHQQQESPLSLASGVVASATSGTYILNPSSDLVKTESRFRGPLSSLTTWTSLVREPPTSDFFSTALTRANPRNTASPDVLVYIGHGSGTQYIRHKSIKRLSLTPGGCNVALLFGCSSASLKEAGEFEPYGTPKSYLLGGAPAVLGSLWDVTDGDTDCFAGKVLERWGLLEEGSCEFSGRKGKEKAGKARGRKTATAEKTPAKKSGRSRSRKRMEERLCLSEAVARSRGDCYLRYLNGAAMVVYGVPVFLER